MYYFYKIISKIFNIFIQKPCIPILKRYGLKIGKNVAIEKGTIIDESHAFLIEIEDNVTIAPNVHILAHDASTKKIIGYTKIGRVTIKRSAFIGADSVILPNVTIGSNCIVGANSLVSKSIPDNEVWAGNPAKKICTVEEYYKKIQNMNLPKFDESFRINKNPSKQKKNQLLQKVQRGLGLIK